MDWAPKSDKPMGWIAAWTMWPCLKIDQNSTFDTVVLQVIFQVYIYTVYCFLVCLYHSYSCNYVGLWSCWCLHHALLRLYFPTLPVFQSRTTGVGSIDSMVIAQKDMKGIQYTMILNSSSMAYTQKKPHDKLASAVSVQSLTLYIPLYTLWLFNIPMENCPFIDHFPS
jgi:hypothetical protein